MSAATRQILLVTHTGRRAATASAASLVQRLRTAEISVVALAEEARELQLDHIQIWEELEDAARTQIELVVVLGGDGTILRGAELARPADTPLLGVNLGRVGFLAEAEEQDLIDVAEAIAAKRYTVEERVAVEAAVDVSGEVVHTDWALNEISVEKAERQRMLELGIEVDRRRLSRWGCDGVVCATPTGSTAYAFSAGGPVVWPEVEALLLVPLSAHALFARPMVVAPTSQIGIDLLPSAARGVLWADGRRSVDLPPGASVTISRSQRPVRLARLHSTPFTERLVAKSPSRYRAGEVHMETTSLIEELRIQGLGIIDDAQLEFSPRLTAVTGETGAGKTMVVTGLGLLLGQRADSGAIRSGADRAVVEGTWRIVDDAPVGRRIDDAGGVVEDQSVVMLRSIAAQGRSRAHVGGASVPLAVLTEIADELIAVHGQADQQKLAQPAKQKQMLDAFAGAEETLARYRERYEQLLAVQSELSTLLSERAERLQEADLLRFGLAEIAEVEPESGEDQLLKTEDQRLAHAEDLRNAAHDARQALVSDDDLVAATTLLQAAIRSLAAMREHDPEIGELVDRISEVEVLATEVASDLLGYLDRVEADPRRLAQVGERRAALGRLTGKYGDTIEELLDWQQRSGKRLMELDSTDDDVERLRGVTAGLRREVSELASSLSQERAKAATRLAKAVTAELVHLAMTDSAFIVAIEQSTVESDSGLTLPDGRVVSFGPDGIDSVGFLLRPHPDAPARPLGKGASGGEISRVMLALEVVVAAVNPVPTFVFDEVDAGVGGAAAVEVGRRLSALSRHAQVIVVTHLPQVAAFADRHLVVTKSSSRHCHQ